MTDENNKMTIAVVMPVYREGEAVARRVQVALEGGAEDIVVVVGLDAHRRTKSDTAWQALQPLLANWPAVRVISQSPPGRAKQMNAGAAVTKSEVMLFLHADTELPPDAIAQIRQTLSLSNRKKWGRFDVCFNAQGTRFRLLAWLMNWRSALTGICTGDQAMFVRREAFDAVGGFPDQALMEDIEISKRLKRISLPVRIRSKVTTSARRWQQNGWLRTVLLMWRMRLAYYLGASPEKLASWYRHAR